MIELNFEWKDGNETVTPEFVEKLESVTVADGAEATFQVKLKGSNVNVTWFRQTQIVKNSKDFQVFSHSIKY